MHVSVTVGSIVGKNMMQLFWKPCEGIILHVEFLEKKTVCRLSLFDTRISFTIFGIQ